MLWHVFSHVHLENGKIPTRKISILRYFSCSGYARFNYLLIFSAFGNAKNALIRNIKLKNILKGINAHGRAIWEGLGKSTLVSTLVSGTYENLKKIAESLAEPVQKLWEDFKDFTKRTGETIANTAKEWMRNAKDMINRLGEMIDRKIDDVSDAAKRFYDDLKDSMKRLRDKISDAYDDFKKRMRDFWDKLKDKATELFDDFLDWIRSFDPVRFSPFLVFIRFSFIRS